MRYLFGAVPPYSGSTVLHNYLSKCTAVAGLTNEFRETTGVSETGITEGNAATKARDLYGDIGVKNIRIIPGAFTSVITDLETLQLVGD